MVKTSKCRRLRVVILCLLCGIVFFTVAPYRNENTETTVLPLITKREFGSRRTAHTIVRVNYNSSAFSCDELPPFLLCIVHSSPRHFLFRATIRKTWGSLARIGERRLRLVFLVGNAKEDRIQSKLSNEMVTYHDLIRGDFLDSYRNLTYKHIMGYQWVMDRCRSAVYVLKADDDVFVDMFRAVSFLVNTFGTEPHHLLACLIVPPGSETKRSGKWAVTKEEYAVDEYKEYCSGMAYFVTPPVIQQLLSALPAQEFFWVDDVFVTGQLATAAGVKRTDLSVWFARHEYLLLDWLSGNASTPCPWMFGEMSARNWPENVMLLWKKTFRSWKSSKREKREVQ